jgi:hypothetical protein
MRPENAQLNKAIVLLSLIFGVRESARLLHTDHSNLTRKLKRYRPKYLRLILAEIKKH